MRQAVLVQDSDSLKTVLCKMVNEKRNSLTVVDSEGHFVGAVNALDIIQQVLPEYIEDDAVTARFVEENFLKEETLKVQDCLVKDFMSKDLPTIKSDATLVEASVLATQAGRGRITVVDKA